MAHDAPLQINIININKVWQLQSRPAYKARLVVVEPSFNLCALQPLRMVSFLDDEGE